MRPRYPRGVRHAATLLALMTAGCSSEHLVTVDLYTDYLPGVEFAAVRTTVAEGDVLPSSHSVDGALDYGGGQTVAQLVLPEGTHRLTVALLDDEMQPVLDRPVVVEVIEDRVVSALITRDCAGVSCAGGESPEACLGGVCTSAQCTFENRSTCDVNECSADADCGDPDRPTCVRSRCLTGVCAYVPGNCRPDEVCHPDLGCRPAANPFRCSPPDDDTVFLLSFDDESAADAIGGNDGSIVGEPQWIDGPLGCGRAIRFPLGGTTHVEIPDSMDWHLGEGSVDFWFLREMTSSGAAGLLGRDRDEFGNGHFSVLLSNSDELFVRLRNAAEMEIASCSERLTRGEWHHVGINFGPQGLELWVDGEVTMRTGLGELTDSVERLQLTCGGGGTIAIRPADVLDWVVGASALHATAPGEWSDFFDAGAIDELRISAIRRDFSDP